MKRFTRKRTLDEIDKECAERRWVLDTRRFKAGDDCISFRFQHGRTKGLAVINTFSGRVIGQLDGGLHFTSDNADNDRKGWFKELLKVAFV